MAIYHLSAKTISRATGRSATGAAAYRAGETITDERTGLIFDYSKKQGIDHTEIMSPTNAPEWVHDRAKLWNSVEHSEKRNDSQLAREIEVALPTELTPDQQRELVRGFIRSQFVDVGMVADIAIHHTKSENPHAHILLTMRDIGVDGFGKKNRSWNDKALLQNWREAWEVHTNQALEQAGHSVRIDHRTLAEQGIERIPQIHIGPKVLEMERRGIQTEIGEQALAIEHKNKAITALQSDLETVRNERNHEAPAGSERGADRGRTGTAGRVAGDTGRPGRGQHQEHGSGQLATGQGMEQPATERSEPDWGSSQERDAASRDIAAGNGQSQANSRGGEEDAAGPVAEAGSRGGYVIHPRSGAIDRIVALAGTAPRGTQRTGRESGSGAPARPDSKRAQAPIKPDRSYLAARRQLDAMGVERFEVGVRDQAGRMLIRTWSTPEILQNMAWLKRENAKGADVYVRPAGETNAGLVLVDDLNRGQLARMQAAGMAPASVTETSPDNFQAWVRVHEKHLEPKLATEVATMLAKEYGGDPNSADWRHFGRLAGLTNAKRQHKDANGRSPYVLAHESGGKLAPAGPALVQQAAQRVLDREAQNDRRSRLEAAQEASGGPRTGDPIHTYRCGLKSLHTRFGASMDLSRADYMIGVDMVLKGFKPDQVAQAIEQASPELPIRKAGHEGDYVARTVEAIMASPKVTEWQQEQAQRRSRSGPSLGM
ncbi:hypothetical protein ADT33_11200 (plasmid) [Xylella fastidiosa]|nr:MobQ family relaxase [Xylella fastidiosa]KXB09921.1 hypothetical protein ADT33_11200 [Xylella fastidiosa]